MKRKTLLLFIIACFFAPIIMKAHTGGHFHQGDGTIFNNWRLKNGTVLSGNFSMSKDNIIYLEQLNGRILAVAMQDLTEQDQKLARFKMHQFQQINGVNEIIQTPFSIFQLITNWLFYIALISCGIIVLYELKPNIFRILFLNERRKYAIVVVTLISTFVIACSKTSATSSSTNNNGGTNPISITLPKTTTGFIDSAFMPYKPSLSTKWDDTYFYVASTGIPNHNMMIGITSWQQQVPISQPYTDNNSWSIHLQPSYATTPLSTKTNLMKGAVAIAVNGIPIFNALNNRGEDSYLIGELDNWGGHCGRGDDYHYHAAPLHLSSTSGLKPIAFALDGFPVYGSKEPDGTNMALLDTCHGHVGSNGIYHYHGTIDYPYVVGAMKGKVNLDPTTPAPENQILPQAFTKPVRPATNPLKGAFITDFVAVGNNGYLLTYKIGTKNGYVKYNWDLSNKYTFTLTDTAGIAVTTSYQR